MLMPWYVGKKDEGVKVTSVSQVDLEQPSTGVRAGTGTGRTGPTCPGETP